MSEYKKTALVLGAGGFIGSHMVKRLRSEGYWVRGVDLKHPEFSETEANEFIAGDLRDVEFVRRVIQYKGEHGNFYNSVPYQHIEPFNEIYQFAADMGGAGFVFTGENDAEIMHNSCTINLNVLEEQRKLNETFDGVEKTYTEANRPKLDWQTKIFYSGSACMYPEHNQLDPNNPDCREDSAYPAAPDSEYGWEKLFSERLYLAYNRNHGIPVRVARYHNIFGPEGTWTGGREKAPAAICRKIAELPGVGGPVEVWGDGEQTRSFLYIDECIEATRRLMDSDFLGPVNIGSEEMVTINELVRITAKVAGTAVSKRHEMNAPLGVRGRNSNNDLVREKLGWDYEQTLEEGIRKTYAWIKEQVDAQKVLNEESVSKEPSTVQFIDEVCSV
jgi:nucleoside-diphosphate-sugar epimerase